MLGSVSKQNRGPVAALLFTILLLLVSSWNLYSEHPSMPINAAKEAQPEEAKRPPTAAAILETRPLAHLIPLVLHFSTVLGPEWPIHVFTSQENIATFMSSAAFKRKIAAKEVILRDLQTGLSQTFGFHESYLFSEFLIQPWFWEQMAPADHILLFRADSMICSKSEESIDDFLGYDFLGAVLPDKIGVSGGFSLRNRTRMLDIVQGSDWQEEKHGDREESTGKAKVDYEARWFWKQLRELERLEDDVKVPPIEVAKSFAVGARWEERPFGYDQVHLWHNTDDEIEEIMTWCPEYRLVMSKD